MKVSLRYLIKDSLINSAGSKFPGKCRDMTAANIRWIYTLYFSRVYVIVSCWDCDWLILTILDRLVTRMAIREVIKVEKNYPPLPPGSVEKYNFI